jgi:hypothetical protein
MLFRDDLELRHHESASADAADGRNRNATESCCSLDPTTNRRRISFMRRISGAIALITAACLTVAPPRSEATVSARAPGVTPVRFKPAVGWHVRTGSAHACPGVSASRCAQVTTVASTSAWLDCVECAPHRTLAAIPSDGIAIRFTVALEPTARARRTFKWPAQVSLAEVNAPFEGLPSRIGVYQASTRVGTRDLFVFVYFGRDKPSTRQLKTANDELREARLG